MEEGLDKEMKELQLSIEELKNLMSQATRPKVKDILSIEVRKLETNYVNKLDSLKVNQPCDQPAKKSVPNPNISFSTKLTNYAWDQSDKFVKLFIPVSNVQTIPEENVTHEFTERSVSLNIKELENKNYSFKLANLLEDINASKSYIKIKKDNVYVYLAKSKEKEHWTYLTTTDKAAKESRMPKLDKDEDPAKGMMDMMRQMYEDGDDNMKRTIANAWMESKNKAPYM